MGSTRKRVGGKQMNDFLKSAFGQRGSSDSYKPPASEGTGLSVALSH